MTEFLPEIPADLVTASLMRMPGNEIKSGKIDGPESTAALVANAFGWFLGRAKALPELRGGLGPTNTLELFEQMHLPWSGGKQPWLDVAVETDRCLIGIAARRYEPYRPAKKNEFENSYDRPAWGDKMEGYTRLRRTYANGARRFAALDMVQLVKDAYGLRTEALRREKRAVLLYLYAEPAQWANGRAVDQARIAAHRADIKLFAESVTGDEVAFAAMSWAEMLDLWAQTPACAAHAARVRERFGVL